MKKIRSIFSKIRTLFVAEDISRLKQEFVSNVSHELRTPLTSIRGFVDTIVENNLITDPTGKKFMNIIQSQVLRLSLILEDLLILSELESGSKKHRLEFKTTNLSSVLSSAIEVCTFKAKEKNIAIDLECSNEIEFKINANLIESAVVNLIDNAIKYSPKDSSIHVFVYTKAGLCTISVKDEGCGIDAKYLPKLFERFFRVDKARSRELGGTGLGLAIVKHIALIHNGTTDIQSKLGVGTTVSIILNTKF